MNTAYLQDKVDYVRQQHDNAPRQMAGLRAVICVTGAHVQMQYWTNGEIQQRTIRTHGQTFNYIERL